ncbi:hypothetical protein GDO86_008855 [Hymenochirus boettgeri]|uniref:Catalase n=1 Tax=Hymenochirus boettgeri TaxID=247094 RepID=A0A8T2J3U1_9PIPI|nr:hypothetical protein GDO86_008855 [Hymenochirus boettgeri]
MAHFNRERIPERTVHAKGVGAFGYFEVTNDITRFCKSKVFEKVGKKTPITVRFSSTSGELGSSDNVRETRGFAVKFHTEEGIWDLVGNHTPIFLIRDPILVIPSVTHAQKRNPQTTITMLFTDRGIPFGFRHMHGFGNHAFKLVNKEGKAVYAKFHYKTNQGIKTLTQQEAQKLGGADPDYAVRDLTEAIAKGDFPSWTLYIQVMTFEQAEKLPFNPFDITKVWCNADFPLIPVGTIKLDRNPQNHFAEVEQLAFEPKNLVPGIEPSPDKMLHGRLFAYSDAQRYRLGVNYPQLPVNRSTNAKVANYQRDGFMTIDNQGNSPNYTPNSFGGPKANPKFKETAFHISGDVDRFEDLGDDVFQVRDFYRKVLNDKERQVLCDNLANTLIHVQEFIQKRAIVNFTKVDPDYGARVQSSLNKLKATASKDTSQITQDKHPVDKYPVDTGLKPAPCDTN